MTGLTPPQRHCLTVVRDLTLTSSSVTPRQVAKAMWPNSPGWEKRTRRFGSNRNGAMGGTMPMKAATLLWRLEPLGLVFLADNNNAWMITPKGRRVLDGTEPEPTVPRQNRTHNARIPKQQP